MPNKLKIITNPNPILRKKSNIRIPHPATNTAITTIDMKIGWGLNSAASSANRPSIRTATANALLFATRNVSGRLCGIAYRNCGISVPILLAGFCLKPAEIIHHL